ncbi:hypothetical protein QBC32DRAFT_27455 [Pseudoneurospora amorphoporcata]|uniref:Rhodopsin domain-containing protein n=1 Tax=Pseudoneurospora amorphoporcata TaxID=241081 RepID=A0AAN6SDR4_9PEZI|nr:hypothetical protein QBC32DRAFT_27455 [Pseudoneurospora amorphoporcata]
MRIPPPQVQAQWPEANYENPQRRGPAILILELVMLPLSLLFVALRLYVRGRLVGKTGWDDWLMIVATIFGTAVSILVILASTLYGWDKHLYDLSLVQLSQGRQISMSIQAVFIFSSSLAKVSILISYLALAPLDSWFRRLTKYAMAFIILVSTGSFILLFTQCHPLASYWDAAGLPSYDSRCIPEGFPLMTQAILTVVADFIVWALPLPTFYRARIPMHQRVIIIGLFSAGLFVVFAACIRTYWVHYVVWETWDPTWEGIHIWAWTAVEIHLGIMCGCVPYFKSLFNRKANKKGSSAAKSWSGSRAGGGGGVKGASRVEVGVKKCVSFTSERSQEPLSPTRGAVVDGVEEMELQEKRMNTFTTNAQYGHDGKWGFEFDGARGMHGTSVSGGSTFGNRVEIWPGR